MDSNNQSLDERAKELEKIKHDLDPNEPIAGVRLDLLGRIMKSIEANNKMEELLGKPVNSKLAIIFDGKDVTISELGTVELNESQKEIFLMELNGIMVQTMKETAQMREE